MPFTAYWKLVRTIADLKDPYTSRATTWLKPYSTDQEAYIAPSCRSKLKGGAEFACRRTPRFYRRGNVDRESYSTDSSCLQNEKRSRNQPPFHHLNVSWHLNLVGLRNLFPPRAGHLLECHRCSARWNTSLRQAKVRKTITQTRDYSVSPMTKATAYSRESERLTASLSRPNSSARFWALP